MRVISRKRPRCEEHPEAEAPLKRWYDLAIEADWKSAADASRTFGNVDPVRVSSGNTILAFNVGGNKYRLVAAVHFKVGPGVFLKPPGGAGCRAPGAGSALAERPTQGPGQVPRTVQGHIVGDAPRPRRRVPAGLPEVVPVDGLVEGLRGAARACRSCFDDRLWQSGRPAGIPIKVSNHGCRGQLP